VPAPSKIDQLDDPIRRELDARIIANGFGGYVALSDWLAERGYSIGKSAVGAYGQRLERRLGAIRASTEAARMIAAAAPDDADERSAAIISLVQTEIFESLLALQDATDEADPAKRVEILGKAAKNIATLTRASVTRNKWAQEVRGKLDTARAEVRKLASGAGVSDETLAAIDARLLGVV
jgi:hypothetical protein